MTAEVVGAVIQAIPLAFIGWLFVSLTKRIDNLTTRIDRLYELMAQKNHP